MGRWRGWIVAALVAALCPLRASAGAAGSAVPILLYHRFGPVARDSMTVRTSVFEAQLEYLRDHGYRIVRLGDLVNSLRGAAPAQPPRSVAITADDGHQSVYTELFPLVKRYRFPVTLFIYPSAISHASYALTWTELKEMQDSGLVDIQSHTYWHPNFAVEKKRLTPGAYQEFVAMQLEKSKATLEHRLGIRVDMLAWPYGIFDRDLISRARSAGYVAAFSMLRAPARPSDDIMALPRYLVLDRDSASSFARLLQTPREASK
jgi:peptidoglycan/xylan/chitin deacetylase (PgdA/CDA1 family)